MSLVDDIATYLEGLGVGTEIHRGGLWDSPAEAMGVEDYPGLGPQYVHDAALPAFERPHFQVRTRGTPGDYDTPHDAAYAAWRALSVHDTVINGTKYISIEPLASPFKIGVDGNDRVLFVANFTTRREA